MKMWYSLACLILLLPLGQLNGQVITTYASGSLIYDPQQLAFDSYGNLYCAGGLGNQVVKIDTAGIVSVFAGTGTGGYSGDGGLATLAELWDPHAIAIDTSGNVYIADAENNRIRKVNTITGIISTIAGTGYGSPTSGSFSGDGGQATSADLFYPGGLQFDKFGNLYVTDYRNNRIRKINTSGIITTVVGNGVSGSTGDGESATVAECTTNYNVCIDALGNLYFINLISNTIRKVNTLGIISTIAGDSTGTWTYAGDGVPALGAPIGPLAITFDENGLLVIADANNRIRRIDNSGVIHTIAGDGIVGDSGDDGTADSAELYTPDGIAYDACGNLYIAQVDEPRIRKVTFNPSCTYANVKVPELIDNNVVIYPNPAYEVININNVKAGAKYRILNITGIIEQSGTLKEGNNSINIQAVPNGMYMLEIIDNEEGKKVINKVIKQ